MYKKKKRYFDTYNVHDLNNSESDVDPSNGRLVDNWPDIVAVVR